MSTPTARSARAYNWGDSAIASDAVGLEHEPRARHRIGYANLR